MPLPKIDVVSYELTLPILKKTVRYRPFLVKEQKILLMAAETKNSEAIEKAMRQVLNNCCLDDIDVENLSLLDVEYFFLNLRAISVGEIIENRFRCKNVVNDEVCDNLMQVDLNLKEVAITGMDEYKDIIQITEKISVKMTLPKYSLLEKVVGKQENELSGFVFDLLIDCVECIYDGEQTYYAKESSEEELIEFFESLNAEQFKKVQDFFSYIPKLNKDKEVTCDKCGYHHKIEFEGIESFFM
jgi:hypothetical protein